MAGHLDSWILAARPKTLWVTVSPVLIGTAMAWRDGLFHPIAAVLVLISAVLIQIGTNFCNDYADFIKGADTIARKGPRRAVQSGLLTGAAMKRATLVVFASAVLAGAYPMLRAGWPIVLIGLGSILFGVLYSGGRYSLAYLGIADVFVFLFFGPIAVAGTYFVQALVWPLEVWIAGIAPGLLSVSILMVNNIRDIVDDKAAGKKTIVVRLGRGFGLAAYAACILLASGVPLFLVLAFEGSEWSIIGAAILPLSIPLYFRLAKTPVSDGSALNPVLGKTALLLLVYSICFSAGWVYSG